MGRYAGIVVAPSIPINQYFADLSLRLNLHRDRIRIDLCIGFLPSLFPAAIETGRSSSRASQKTRMRSRVDIIESNRSRPRRGMRNVALDKSGDYASA